MALVSAHSSSRRCATEIIASRTSAKTVRAFTAAYFLFYLIDFNVLSGGWPDGLIRDHAPRPLSA
jgi:hypothetical protein